MGKTSCLEKKWYKIAAIIAVLGFIVGCVSIIQNLNAMNDAEKEANKVLEDTKKEMNKILEEYNL